MVFQLENCSHFRLSQKTESKLCTIVLLILDLIWDLASKKSVALKCIAIAPAKLNAILKEDAGISQGSQEGALSADLSQISKIRPLTSALYILNEAITTAIFSERLADNMLHDELILSAF